MKAAAIAGALRTGERIAGEDRRFSVYRNNVASALTSALAVRYPVTKRIAGDRLFSAMAASFIARELPPDPVLIGYGDGFADHIRDFPPAAEIPWLPDVAMLESAWWRAYHAADREPVGQDVFAAISPRDLDALTFTFLPAARIVRSRWPVEAIWCAARRNGDVDQIDTTVEESLLVARPALEVTITKIDEALGGFLLALMQGRNLVKAAAGAQAMQPGFDLTAALSLLISSGIVASIARGNS